MFGCIYRVSLNSRSYIGQYCKPNPAARWLRHKRDASNGSPFYFHRAIQKHGADAFKVEVICTCHLRDLGGLEGYFAEMYDAYAWNNGFNTAMCCTQFALGIPKSDEHKEKIRAGVLANWITRRAKLKKMDEI
jgi:hypothetical protein